jgi:prepilin-type N-terminal cleavage/methylation domain-containing protein
MFTSERGFSVIELLIALAISGIVTAGLYGMAISSSRHYVSQNGVIGLQADGRAAMEFMARDLRRAFGSPTLATTVTTNDTISFDRVEDSGRASGGTTTTLNDDLKAWTPGAMAPPAASAHTLRIIAGTGAGQTRTITANTATQLTVSPALGTAPDTNSLYVITTARAFTKTSSTDHIVRYRVGTTGDHDPLAENITSLAFALPNATTMTVTLTARTKGVDPTTNQYRYYTLTETIRRRNS